MTESDGYLSQYVEEIEGQLVDGADLVGLVAQRQSVNPRLLLSVVEHQSGWVTRQVAGANEYPLGFSQPGYEGLYQQLSWAANKLNQGYYGRAEGGSGWP